MTKKVVLVALFSFLMISLLAAPSSHVLKGVVTDENGSSLPFVNVFLTFSRTGTITNNDGAFSLSFSGNDETMRVSFIGYETQIINVNQNTGLLKIQMKPSAIHLSEFVVSALSAEELLKKTIEKIPENYRQDPFLVKAHARHKVFQTDTLRYMQEVAYNIVKSYRPSFTNEFFLVRNRNFRFTPNFRSKLNGTGVPDVVKYASNTFNNRFFSNHDIRYLPNTTFDNRPVYVLEFSRKNNEDMTRGKIYIDMEDLAFVRFEFNDENGNLIVQYQKIEDEYYLMFGNSSYINRRRNRVIPVETDFLVTDIIHTFSRDDIKGTRVNRDDVLAVYATQEHDTLFWQQHRAILPDSVVLEALERYMSAQEQNVESSKDSIVTPQCNLQYLARIKRLYTPNISLKISTDLANDFSMLNHNLNSVNRYVLFQLERNIHKFVPKVLSILTYSCFISPSIGNAASEWLLLNKNGIQAGMNPAIFNRYKTAYLYHVNNDVLSNFKNENYLDFMRLHTIRSEGRYIRSFLMEEEIAKIDIIQNTNNMRSYMMLYWLELFGHRIANMNSVSKKDVKQSNKPESRQPLVVDPNRSWVKYLFNPEMEYQRHVQQDDLTEQERKYLKRSNRRSWLNLLSPQMLFMRKFPIGQNHSFTFSVSYLPIPFGEMFGQNIWLMTNHRQLHGLSVKQYRNYEKTTFGIGYKLYDIKLFRHTYMTSSVDFWQQPTNFGFFETSSFNGFHVGQTFEYQLLRSQFSERHKLSFLLGYDYKTNGYMPESFFMEENFNVNIGFKWYF